LTPLRKNRGILKLITTVIREDLGMITEIVTFNLPDGTTREDVFSTYEKTAPTWRENPDLIRKNYLFDAEKGVAGGVYLWKNRADAEKWHGAEFRQKVKEVYGAVPESQFFETPIVVDNLAGEITKD
jgi:hypothetical protein